MGQLNKIKYVIPAGSKVWWQHISADRDDLKLSSFMELVMETPKYLSEDDVVANRSNNQVCNDFDHDDAMEWLQDGWWLFRYDGDIVGVYMDDLEIRP